MDTKHWDSSTIDTVDELSLLQKLKQGKSWSPCHMPFACGLHPRKEALFWENTPWQQRGCKSTQPWRKLLQPWVHPTLNSKENKPRTWAFHSISETLVFGGISLLPIPLLRAGVPSWALTKSSFKTLLHHPRSPTISLPPMHLPHYSSIHPVLNNFPKRFEQTLNNNSCCHLTLLEFLKSTIVFYRRNLGTYFVFCLWRLGWQQKREADG